MTSLASNASYQPGVSRADLQLIIDKVPRKVWDALRGKRLFITGGTGFVGCWLLEALVWANQELSLDLSLSVLTRNPDAFIKKAAHLAKNPIVVLIQGDVNSLGNINDSFDIIIHAATDVVNQDSDFLTAYNSIVNGSIETLELARRSHATHYLLTSSGAVYGQQPSNITHIPEDYSGAPEPHLIGSAYGQAKRISEWLTHCYAKKIGIHIKIARLFALIGPYLPLDAHFAVGNFIRDGLDQKNIQVSGDGTAFRSYLYAADMVVWLLRILIDGDENATYNLGSDKAISIKDLAETVSDIIYKENKVLVATKPQENSKIQRYVPDVSKAKRTLGLDEYTDLHTSIQKTIHWEVNNRESKPNF